MAASAVAWFAVGIWLPIMPTGWIGVSGVPIWIVLTTALVWVAESRSGAAPAAPT